MTFLDRQNFYKATTKAPTAADDACPMENSQLYTTIGNQFNIQQKTGLPRDSKYVHVPYTTQYRLNK